MKMKYREDVIQCPGEMPLPTIVEKSVRTKTRMVSKKSIKKLSARQLLEDHNNFFDFLTACIGETLIVTRNHEAAFF